MSESTPDPAPSRGGKRAAARPEGSGLQVTKGLVIGVVLIVAVIGGGTALLVSLLSGGESKHGNSGGVPAITRGAPTDAKSAAEAALEAYTTGKCDDFVKLTTKASTDAKQTCLNNAKNPVVKIYGFDLGVASTQGDTSTFQVTYKTEITPVCSADDKSQCPPSQKTSTTHGLDVVKEDGKWRVDFSSGT